MKYGMNMLLWTSDIDESHYGLLEQLVEIGYDTVEIPVFDMDVAKFQKLGEKLDELGLDRTAVTVATAEANPVSESPAVRDAGLNLIKEAIDCCAAAGAAVLCGPYHSALGEFTGQGRTQDEWERSKEVLAQAAEHGKVSGVTLGLEFLNRFECYFLNSAVDTAKFVSEVNHPNLKMMYDTFHANIEEKNAGDAIRAAADHLVHVHISENDRSTPGQGNVNWDDTFATLKAVGYDNRFVVEAFGLALPALAAATKIWRKMYDEEAKLAKDALDFMKRRWEG